MTLSAVLVVRDEEQMLEAALRSLDFCDEVVVVVDDRTSDGTEAIARRYTEKVLSHRFVDFAESRNAAVAAAAGDWILHVDADERITPRLASQIREAVDTGNDTLGYWAPTINFFWGRRMDHGGWGRMMQLRLVRREYASFSNRVHEQTTIPRERTRTLDGERWHFSHRSISENLRKAMHYGRLEAADAFDAAAPPVTLRSIFRVMALDFGRRMIRRRGYRDGMPGIIEGLFQPFALFCGQVMLWELQQGDDVDRRYAQLERQLRDVT